MNKNLGTRVETVWKDLRPVTKEMLVGVLKKKNNTRKQKSSYDAHSDSELSRLLGALDESTVNNAEKLDLNEIRRLADICASVLEDRTESAETFIQLATRALKRQDYAKIDKLGDALLKRFSVVEIIEVIKQTDAAHITALAYETLAVKPVSSIASHIKDPAYFEIVCNVLDQQAVEFDNLEAQMVLDSLSASFDFG